MKVKQIEYRKLVSGPGFNNETYGVTLELTDYDSHDEAVELARQAVDRWFSESGEAARREQERMESNRQKWQMDQEIKERTRKVKALLDLEAKIRERLGVEATPAFEDEIPF